MSTILAHDSATASLFAGFIGAIGRDPSQWDFPESTFQYLHHRIDTLAADLLLDGATGTVVA